MINSSLESLPCQPGGAGEADRTKVSFSYQLLIIALAFCRGAIPIAWTWVRGAKGHSSAWKQMALLSYVHKLVPADTVLLVGNSEFGAVEIIRQLKGWRYVLRQILSCVWLQTLRWLDIRSWAEVETSQDIRRLAKLGGISLIRKPVNTINSARWNALSRR